MAGAAQRDCTPCDASGGPSRICHRGRTWPVRRNPSRGAVAWRGGAPGRCARWQRDRTRPHGVRAGFEWRPDRDWEPRGAISSHADRCAGGSAPTTRRLLRPQLRHRGRLDRLWPRFDRPEPARGRLRRPPPQVRGARRPAGASTNQVRADDQLEDRQSARSRHALLGARPRRRGDRITRLVLLRLLTAGFGTTRRFAAVPIFAGSYLAPIGGLFLRERDFVRFFSGYMKTL